MSALPKRLALRPWLLLGLCLLPGHTWLGASSRNLAPDAVSRATIWNSYTGEVSALNDGLFPPQEATAFSWNTKGILTFSWQGEQPLEKVRLYVGDPSSGFRVRTYQGGQLDETGSVREPEGQRTALVEDSSHLTNGWVEIPFTGEVLADNLELHCLGSVALYEVEIYVRTGTTAVERLNWGQVKAQGGW
ncbi:MAG: hypothetical protein IT369_17590 [Candidatus Latescibacteria bacterium]|nr:hypothetical protein [Candidatus Latescibacterota bacterium]